MSTVLSHTKTLNSLAVLSTLATKEDFEIVAINYGQESFADWLEVCNRYLGNPGMYLQGMFAKGDVPLLTELLFPITSVSYAVEKGASKVVLDLSDEEVGSEAMFLSTLQTIDGILQRKSTELPQIARPIFKTDSADIRRMASEFIEPKIAKYIETDSNRAELISRHRLDDDALDTQIIIAERDRILV
jgi:hypothetical protein